jgi:type IV secretory pathway protease TraF
MVNLNKEADMLKTALFILAVVLFVQVTDAQTVGYVRGDMVRLVGQENGSPYPDFRIVAIAGDRVHGDKSSLTVNGLAVQGVSAELLRRVAEPWDKLIPEGYYFVVAESGTHDDMVRYYGLIPASKIIQKL